MKKLIIAAVALVFLVAVGALAVTTPKNVTGSSISDVIAQVVHGTVSASKAVIVDASKDITGFRHVTVTGNIVTGSTTISEADLAFIDGVTAGTAAADKAVVLTTDKHIDTIVISDGGLKLGSGAGTAVSATAAELNLIDGSIAGTAVASKALVVDANLRVDSLDVTALEIGNVAIAATGVEINNECDVSGQLQAITGATAVTVDGSKRRATLSGGAYAITLAVPAAAAIGAVLTIEYTGGDTDAVTLALTNVIGESGGTTATFNADGEGITFIGTALGWVVLKEFGGVTLA